MKNSIYSYKPLLLCNAAFSVIVVVSNILSAKMVNVSFFDLMIPAGLFTYPLTFLLSDLVTEFYGTKAARLMVYITLGMNILTFGLIQFALMLPATSPTDEVAFQAILGLSGLRIFASLTAYFISQILDIQVYAFIKKLTNDRFLWLRNNGATAISQLVDTILIDIIFLYWGLAMPLSEVIPIIIAAFSYKLVFGILNTPIFYMMVNLMQWNTKWWNKATLEPI